VATPIEFWFDFSSPYAYFAAMEIEARLARFERAVQWRPFLLGVAFKKTGMGSLSHTPLRGNYARHDWHRIAALLSVPFKLREDHPFRSQTLARTYYWFSEQDTALAIAFAKAAFNTYFGLGANLSDTNDVIAVAVDFTDEVGALTAWLASDQAKRILRDRTDEALVKGVFGSPFFLVDSEPFWGWDRLPMLVAWLARDNRPETAEKGSSTGDEIGPPLS